MKEHSRDFKVLFGSPQLLYQWRRPHRFNYLYNLIEAHSIRARTSNHLAVKKSDEWRLSTNCVLFFVVLFAYHPSMGFPYEGEF